MDATAINGSGPARSAASITLEDIGKTYPDGTVAVGDFSLEVRVRMPAAQCQVHALHE